VVVFGRGLEVSVLVLEGQGQFLKFPGLTPDQHTHTLLIAMLSLYFILFPNTL
jgi:hypothetical protein